MTTKIEGGILQGFSVKASGDIYVQDMVEAASIESGGSVYLKTGIKGHGKGKIKAESSIEAKYIERAFIEAGKDVITSSLIDSQVFCGGKIHAMNGSGSIVGGDIRAARGVEANNIGSDTHKKMILKVGVDYYLEKEIRKNLDELKELEVRQKRIIERLDQRSRTGYSRKQLMDFLIEISAPLEGLKQKRIELSQRIGRILYADIRVKETIYPGVIVYIGFSKRVIEKPYSTIRIYYGSEKREILFSTLR